MGWTYFKLDDFACKCGCGENKIDAKLVDMLDVMRAKLGFPLVVSSGYRCPKHNAAVSSSGATGPHTTGKAVDILVMGHKAFQLISVALEYSKVSGLGLNQKGDHSKRFVHLDIIDHTSTIKRPTVWTY